MQFLSVFLSSFCPEFSGADGLGVQSPLAGLLSGAPDLQGTQLRECESQGRQRSNMPCLRNECEDRVWRNRRAHNEETPAEQNLRPKELRQNDQETKVPRAGMPRIANLLQQILLQCLSENCVPSTQVPFRSRLRDRSN